MDFARLYTLQGTTQEEFDRIKKGILAMADENERDTHFQGFARLLWDELKEFDPYDFDLTPTDSWQILHSGEGYDPSILEEQIKGIIAHCAYDLVLHVLRQVTIPSPPEQIIQGLDDLTEWPPTETEQ